MNRLTIFLEDDQLARLQADQKLCVCANLSAHIRHAGLPPA